ncbi:MAG: hypothetical protein Ct9H300mP13_1570 [Gammaproteobacteria bacterium]|nr:MAG: hypothetical protein Ct9H300mP13_1570 [Gammaproteobacteria bacterium]
MRLTNKIAMVVGAGQTPGPTMGNGRATALLFAREGAQVLAVDRDIDSAQETVELIHQEGGKADAVAADVIDENSLEAAVNHCNNLFGPGSIFFTIMWGNQRDWWRCTYHRDFK